MEPQTAITPATSHLDSNRVDLQRAPRDRRLRNWLIAANVLFWLAIIAIIRLL
jgi:hypothetical protein